MLAWSKICSALRTFGSAQRGNVAITFALVTLPIIAGVGFAVDYSNANSVRTAMQAALDSTALMIAKEASTDSADTLNANAQKYFSALFSRPDAKNVIVSASYSSSGGTSVVVSGSADVPTTLLGIIGYDTITVKGSSTTTWGMNRLRVALVLDNTGSMADAGKMTALQSATKNLLTQLKNAASTDGDVYVSIVPFVKDADLGSGNWNSNWIYWGTTTGSSPQDPTASDNSSWDANNGTCSAPFQNYSPRSSCVSHYSCSISGYYTQSSCTGAGTCSLSGYTSSSSCTSAGTCSISGRTTQSNCTTGVCSLSGYTTQSTCTAAGVCSNPAKTTQSACTTQKACTNSSYTTQFQCTFHGGTWGYGTWATGVWTPPGTWTAGAWTAGVWQQATWTPNAHSTWNGCVMDRGNATGPDTINNYDTNVVQPDVTKNASLYPAEQSPYCSTLPAAMGLTYDWSALNALVNDMSPNGSTNQNVGLQLGWMSLVGGGPFSVPAMDPNYQYTQAIILLTDGLNTQDRWYGDGYSLGTSDDAKIDARQQLTCANAKAAGLTLYMIQVNTGGDPTSSLLQGCASSTSTYPQGQKFFLLTSASQIATVFTQIGTNLSQLRVAK